jgi:CheY-like chemotaxis protein
MVNMFFRRRRQAPGASAASIEHNDGVQTQCGSSKVATTAQCFVYGSIESHSASANSDFPSFGSGLEELRGLRLLLAEDHEPNASLVIEDLEHYGSTVVHALNGESTCQIIMSGAAFDAILMDCQMPVVDGFEATSRIRAWERQTGRCAVPIIALTGLPQEFEHAHSKSAGMNGYLLKPVDTLQIALAIHAARRTVTR